MLKKLITIFILVFGITFTLFAQRKDSQQPAAPAKIVRFFPNPASSNINFELPQGYDKSYTLQVYNFMGKKVYEQSPSSPRINLSLSEFYRGLYVFQLRDKTGKIVDSGRFQVVK